MSLEAARARLLVALATSGRVAQPVIDAIGRIPREDFVPPTFLEHCYDDTALPIGQGQTISQPSVVALMTTALAVTDRMKVLEVGTGSGYQTAVLARLTRRVYTIERHAALAKDAETRLLALRIHNVTAKVGDGSKGWPEQAPFDRILVTAAAQEAVPPALVTQLPVGGVMVVPIARSAVDQRLLRVVRTEEGAETEDLGPTRFVPLVAGDDAPATVAAAIKRLRRS